MKKKIQTAVIYIRVSTEEQVANFSLRSQETHIRNYCQREAIQILAVYEDHHSAKDFDRPNFNKLKSDLKKKLIKFDVLVTYNMNRFSRNIQETMSMVQFFTKRNIKVFTLEGGEINFTDSNKFFPNVINAAAAQYDNILRAENTKRGMWQGLLEGKWMWKAPYGYRNNSLTKIMDVDDSKAPIVRFCFETFATGLHQPEQVRQMAVRKGYGKSLQGFLDMLKNPLYIGKIRVKEFNGEPEKLVSGDHPPIVEEKVFYQVQRILQKKKKSHTKLEAGVTNHLRGKIICSECGELMTSSKSRGGSGKYVEYYHCQHKKGCKVRIRTDEANAKLVQYLKELQPKEHSLILFRSVLGEIFKVKNGSHEFEKLRLEKEINALDKKIEAVDDKFIDDLLDVESYKRIKGNYEFRKSELMQKHLIISGNSKQVSKFLSFGITLLADLSSFYVKADVSSKRKIISSIFPKNLVLSNDSYRTTEINKIISLLFNTGKDITLQNLAPKLTNSSLVVPARIELASKV